MKVRLLPILVTAAKRLFTIRPIVKPYWSNSRPYEFTDGPMFNRDWTVHGSPVPGETGIEYCPYARKQRNQARHRHALKTVWYRKETASCDPHL